MTQHLKQQVLQSFKRLHRTRENIFEGDLLALDKLRLQINEEYRKNKDVKDSEMVKDLIKLARDVETELRTTVVQAVETEPGKYEARITPDTIKLDNVPFKDCSPNSSTVKENP